MAQQGIVTINGYVGGKPRRLGQEGGTPISVFNMGTTRSFFSQASGQWVDLPTLWVKVKAFRSLALNVLDSVHKGEPVIVTGQIGMEEWTDRDGRQQTTIVINATNIGHDLNTGRSVFTKMPRNNQNGQGDQQNGQNAPGDPQQNGEGRDPFNESQGYGGNQGFGNQGDQGYGGNQQWNNQQGSNQQASGGPGYGNQGYANQRGYGVGDGGGASGPMNGMPGPSGQSAPGAFDRGVADAGPSAWSQRNQQSSQQPPVRAQEQSSQTGIQTTQTSSLQSGAAPGSQPGESAQSGESAQPTTVQQSAPAPAVQTDSFGTETENGNEEF